jgi:hypothetical protein
MNGGLAKERVLVDRNVAPLRTDAELDLPCFSAI